MKIVQIIPSFNVGGGELLAVRLCAEILRQRPEYNVYLISLYDPTPTVVYDEALSSGVKIHSLAKKKGFDPFVVVRMFKMLMLIRPDVIHTHLAGLRYSILASILFRRVVKIHTVHNIAKCECSTFVQYFHKFAFKYFSWQPVALSKEVKKSIQDVYGINSPIVMNGIKVDDSLKNIEREQFKLILGISVDKPVIISIGRLCEQKNQQLLLDVFNDVFDKVECLLLLVGEDTMGGYYQKALMDKIASFSDNIRSNVIFLGPRSDIPDLLSASDVFVLSSDWEGVPLTLLEAMGAKVPVVCTSVGGIPDVIEHEIDGLLVPKGDKNRLADAILSILLGHCSSVFLVNNAWNKFQMFYSIERTAAGYLNIYNA